MADTIELDPAIAEAMGFSGFGTQPNKKRKYNTNDGFVDPDAEKNAMLAKPQGKGANNVPLGSKTTEAPSEQTLPVRQESGHRTAIADENQAIEQQSNAGPKTDEFNRLRNGVKDERGDVAYFMPSFIEDPWEKLIAQRATGS